MTAQNIKKLNKELALSNPKGFTLIELLVVIGILAILLAITLIAINPARQFAQANNTKRRSDVNTILSAIGQFQADSKGTLPVGIDNTDKEIAAPASATKADLCAQLVTKYVASLPVDPKVNNGTAISSPCPATYSTGYHVTSSAADNRVTVSVDPANQELGEAISVTR